MTVNDVHNSVLKVFVWHVQPNYKQPWCSDSQTSSTSSAWPIRLDGALRVVTNAHSVEHAALVQVKRHRHEQKFVAKVLCIGTDCDLALLDVPYDEFWKAWLLADRLRASSHWTFCRACPSCRTVSQWWDIPQEVKAFP